MQNLNPDMKEVTPGAQNFRFLPMSLHTNALLKMIALQVHNTNNITGEERVQEILLKSVKISVCCLHIRRAAGNRSCN